MGAQPDARVRLAELLREPGLISSIPEDSIRAVVDAASEQGVVGVLMDRAAGAGATLDDSWALLRERTAGQIAAAALRDAESIEVLRRARDVDLPFVVLKGLALARTVYPQPWMRERSDTDLLVGGRDIPRFDALFESLGYRVLPHVRGELTLPQRHYLRDDHHGFRHAWDLHWKLTSSQALRDAVPDEEVWARAERLEALHGARVPSRPDALLIACVHRLAHHFDDRRLLWLWDIRLLLDLMTDEDVDAFARLAGREPSAAACAHSLAIANQEAGVRIPDRLGTLLRTPAHGRTAFLWSGSRRRVSYLAGEIRAARPADGLGLLRERLLPSMASMRERYPFVPGILLPVAYVWRLIAGIPKWLRAGG